MRRLGNPFFALLGSIAAAGISLADTAKEHTAYWKDAVKAEPAPPLSRQQRRHLARRAKKGKAS